MLRLILTAKPVLLFPLLIQPCSEYTKKTQPSCLSNHQPQKQMEPASTRKRYSIVQAMKR